MTVVDASVFVDALVNEASPGEVARAELRGLPALDVPEIFKAEVASALRGLVQRGDLGLRQAVSAIERVRSVNVTAYAIEPFLRRIWELRAIVTVYDAWYVALAEALQTDLVTADERLAKASGPKCAVRLAGTNR